MPRDAVRLFCEWGGTTNVFAPFVSWGGGNKSTLGLNTEKCGRTEWVSGILAPPPQWGSAKINGGGQKLFFAHPYNGGTIELLPTLLRVKKELSSSVGYGGISFLPPTPRLRRNIICRPKWSRQIWFAPSIGGGGKQLIAAQGYAEDCVR